MLDRQQMELGLENTARGRSGRHGRRRATRARWWFNRMHEVVDQTREYLPKPGEREDQNSMLGTAPR